MASPGQHFGPYTCVRRLGSGGMGETWLGVQRGEGGFEQRVCLKFIHESFRDTKQATELFLREAAIAASLRHSNIVGVIDADAQAGYMALELVEGTDLRSILRELPEHRLPATLVTGIAIELCKGLQYAHTRTRGDEFAGIVHRDLSPANVLISHAGEVKLADFGVAKVIRATGDVASAVRGKLSYMSPEQMAGQGADARSDLFSLGVLLYETLTGERPFDGDNDADTVRRVMQGHSEPIASFAPQTPDRIIQVVERLLRVEPERRFASAAEVIDALSECAPAATVHFELAQLATRVPRHPSRDGGEPAAVPLGAHQERAPALQTRPATFTRARGKRRRPMLIIGLLSFVTSTAAIVSFLLAKQTAVGKETDSSRSRARSVITRADSPESVEPVHTSFEQSAAIPPTPHPTAKAIDVATEPTARNAAGPSSATAGAAAKRAAAVARPAHAGARASLKIGVFPAGQVWVNGRPRGPAPMTLQLSPGAYTIGAGIDKPARTRAIELEPGASERLMFDLQSSEGKAKSP